MKKILITIVAISSCYLMYAQQGKAKSLEPEKSISVSEANQLNGKAEPTINGKSYSQWVNEQKALMRQKETNLKSVEQAPKLQVATITINDVATNEKLSVDKNQTKRLPVLSTEMQKPKVETTPVKTTVVNEEQVTDPRLQLATATISEQEAAALSTMQASTAPAKAKTAAAVVQGNPLFDVNANVTVGQASSEDIKAQAPSTLPKPEQNTEAKKVEVEKSIKAVDTKKKQPVKNEN